MKQTLLLSDMEGKPLAMELNGSFLTVTSDIGFIKMWDFSRRYWSLENISVHLNYVMFTFLNFCFFILISSEAKVHGQSKDIAEAVPDFGEIILARSNCSGNKVSFTIAQVGF